MAGEFHVAVSDGLGFRSTTTKKLVLGKLNKAYVSFFAKFYYTEGTTKL